MTSRKDLAALDGRQLVHLLARPAPAPDGFSTAEWRSVVQLLTSRLSDDREAFSADDWEAASAAVEHVLTAAETAGVMEHDESVIRRLNLSAVVLRRAALRDDILILSPDRIASLFAETVPMTVQQARLLAVDWRSLEIADIRRLRLVKNLVTPMILISHLLSENRPMVEIEDWEEILPLLP